MGFVSDYTIFCMKRQWRQVLRTVYLAPVFFYRRFVSPLTGPNCKYWPTCSRYMVDAVRTHGVFRGTVLGTARILRCNGLYTGGYDPVPSRFSLKLMRQTGSYFRVGRNTAVPDDPAFTADKDLPEKELKESEQ